MNQARGRNGLAAGFMLDDARLLSVIHAGLGICYLKDLEGIIRPALIKAGSPSGRIIKRTSIQMMIVVLGG